MAPSPTGAHVRYGSLADIELSAANVRFVPEAEMKAIRLRADSERRFSDRVTAI